MSVFWLAAIPCSLAMCIGTSIAIGAVDDPTAKIVIRPSVTIGDVISFLLLVVGLLISVLLAHELIHLAAHPKFGFSRHSILGIWPKAGVCYAYYGGEISRNRFLMVIALPLVVLTVAPVLYFWVTGKIVMWLAFVALLNSLGSSFDVLVFFMVLYQAPAKAVIQNNGWDTYWKRC